MEYHDKEVYFGKYCRQCVYLDKSSEDEPCCFCLDEPTNIDSHKPVKFKQKEEKENK